MALATLTVDPGQVSHDLSECGYALLADALKAEEIARLRDRLVVQADREKRMGQAFEDGGAEQQWGNFQDDSGGNRRDQFRAARGGVNQRVWMLVNKGPEFIQLLYHEVVLASARSVLGEAFVLSSHSANIARQGGVTMPLHTDQWWMPQPERRLDERIQVASITREVSSPASSSSPQLIAPAACVNVIWMLVDFSEEIGATRVVPASHRSGRQPSVDDDQLAQVVSATAPAGTALIIDGRIWHGTGANRTARDRLAVLTTFCGPQFRPQENYTVGVSDVVLAGADEHLRSMLGFAVWSGYGRTGDPTDAFARRSEETL